MIAPLDSVRRRCAWQTHHEAVPARQSLVVQMGPRPVLFSVLPQRCKASVYSLLHFLRGPIKISRRLRHSMGGVQNVLEIYVGMYRVNRKDRPYLSLQLPLDVMSRIAISRILHAKVVLEHLRIDAKDLVELL